MASVGTTPVTVGPGPRLVQNLGPDDLYIGHSNVDGAPLVTVAAGIRLSAGESISLASTSTAISVVSSGTSEVRNLSSGSGMYSASVTPVP